MSLFETIGPRFTPLASRTDLLFNSFFLKMDEGKCSPKHMSVKDT